MSILLNIPSELLARLILVAASTVAILFIVIRRIVIRRHKVLWERRFNAKMNILKIELEESQRWRQKIAELNKEYNN